MRSSGGSACALPLPVYGLHCLSREGIRGVLRCESRRGVSMRLLGAPPSRIVCVATLTENANRPNQRFARRRCPGTLCRDARDPDALSYGTNRKPLDALSLIRASIAPIEEAETLRAAPLPFKRGTECCIVCSGLFVVERRRADGFARRAADFSASALTVTYNIRDGYSTWVAEAMPPCRNAHTRRSSP